MATEKQAAFVRSLFAQVETLISPIAEEPAARGLLDRVEALAPTIVTCIAADPIAVEELAGAEVSSTIETLIAVRDEARSMTEKASVPPGIAATNPDKVIHNRFASDCECGTNVPTEQGWAVLHGRKWTAWCPDCSVLMPDDRARRIADLHAEQAWADERIAELEAQFDTLVRGLWDRSKLADSRRGPNLGLAVADPTGRNDLRFYRVQQKAGWDRARVFEVIGGRSDTLLDLDASIAVLTSIDALPSILPPMIAFGREIGECARCGKHLTDEDSRDAGIGPECARKVG